MRLLPTEVMGGMKRLEWLARLRKQGIHAGRHLSPDKGVSVEFAEHREYTVGDDPRNLDWRVMAKSDRNVVKQFIEETNLRVTIVLDASGSMSFQGKMATEVEGRMISKFEYGRYLAAALAYLFIKQGDSVGLVTFDAVVKRFLRAESRPSQLLHICEELYQLQAAQETALAPVLHEVAERVPRRGLVILISDLFDEPEEVLSALHHFDFRQHELVVFHVLAEEELNFPFRNFQRFEDLEEMEPMLQVDPQAVRSAYLEQLKKFVTQLEGGCGNLRADYVPVTTKMPVHDALTRYLGRRARKS